MSRQRVHFNVSEGLSLSTFASRYLTAMMIIALKCKKGGEDDGIDGNALKVVKESEDTFR